MTGITSTDVKQRKQLKTSNIIIFNSSFGCTAKSWQQIERWASYIFTSEQLNS